MFKDLGGDVSRAIFAQTQPNPLYSHRAAPNREYVCFHCGLTAGDNHSHIHTQTVETQQDANYCEFNLKKHHLVKRLPAV